MVPTKKIDNSITFPTTVQRLKMPLNVMVNVNTTNGLLVPVIIGLVAGVVFIFAIHTFVRGPIPPILSISHKFPEKVPIEDELKNIEQIQEVKLFLEKYDDNNSTAYFGHFQNETIQIRYTTWAQVDKDGDGYKETFRRLELTLFYDESGGKPIYKSYDPERLKQIEIRCREQIAISLDEEKAFTDIILPAYDGQVRDVIENAKCLF